MQYKYILKSLLLNKEILQNLTNHIEKKTPTTMSRCFLF